MGQYSRQMQGRFTSTAATAHFIDLPVIPNLFEFWNVSQWGATSATPNEKFQYAIAFSEEANDRAYVIKNLNGVATTANYTLSTGGISFIDASTPMYGAVKTITGITNAAPMVVTSAAHGYAVGDTVLIYGTTAALQVAGMAYTIQAVTTNTFTLDNAVAPGSAATAGFCKQILYPDLYVPFSCPIAGITVGDPTVFTTSVNHNFVVGGQVRVIIPSGWGTTQINDQTGYVTAVTATTVTVDIDSTGATAFAYPSSATAALGITYPQIIPVGDANTGYQASGNNPPSPITIPGAFYANTRIGVLISGNLLPDGDNGIRWRAEFPDLYYAQ